MFRLFRKAEMVNSCDQQEHRECRKILQLRHTSVILLIVLIQDIIEISRIVPVNIVYEVFTIAIVLDILHSHLAH